MSDYSKGTSYSGEQAAYAKALVRVWTDAAYREKFLADPRAALAQEGWQIPDQIGVSIAANSDRSHVVVPLPKRPEGVSEQELHRIAREIIFICC